MVLPVDIPSEDPEEALAEDHQPLMLLALNATDAVEWEELQTKVGSLFLYSSRVSVDGLVLL